MYVTVGFYDDDDDRHKPAEVFVKVAKQGSDLSLLIDGWAVLLSRALQCGDVWDEIRVKFTGYPQPCHLEHVVQAIDACVVQRRAIIGWGEEPGE